MSQNISNNWFQKLNTDSNFLDKQTNTKSVGTADSNFQSFLSQQIKKASPSSTQVKTENTSTAGTDIKPFKKMSTTASKLSVKSPEKPVAKEVSEKSDFSTERNNKVQGTEQSADESKKTIDTKTEESKDVKSTEPNQEDQKTTDLAEVSPELLQQLQSLPEEIVTQLPEELQSLLAEVTEKLQGLTKQAGGSTEKSTDTSAITELTADTAQMNTQGSAVKSETVESLKQLIDQLKSSETVKPEQAKSFEKVLNQLSSDVSQTELAKPALKTDTLSEGKISLESAKNTSENPISPTNNTGKSNSESNSNLNSNVPNQSPATDNKTGKDVKVEVQTETKIDSDTTVHNFSAKAEASSIAFGKQEVTTQNVKNVMHTNIMDQIMNSPKLQIKQTEQGAMMTLKLNPEVLGNVEIKMEIVKGVLQAEISVENMIVKGAIESNLSDLRNALSDKGYQVESLNVSVGQEGGQSQEQQHQQQANERAVNFTAEEMEAINSSYGFETVVNDTRIDYLG